MSTIKKILNINKSYTWTNMIMEKEGSLLIIGGKGESWSIKEKWQIMGLVAPPKLISHGSEKSGHFLKLENESNSPVFEESNFRKGKKRKKKEEEKEEEKKEYIFVHRSKSHCYRYCVQCFLSYLMLLLQNAWKSDGQKKKILIIGEMPALMHGILKSIAEFLKLPFTDTNTGVTFGYYKFSPKQQLRAVASKAFLNPHRDELK
ncbi:hypothetical protein C1646_737556, partial [Rhizophagus diaphanus]